MRSLQVAHRLEGKNVLLIGGGEVAMTRIPKLLPTGCQLTLVAPILHPDLKPNYSHQIHRIVEEEFRDSHLELSPWWSLILLCIPDRMESERIYKVCKQKYGPQQMINVADIPELCDFYFGANVNLTRDGSLQILISSNGVSPRFTALIKNEIETRFNGDEMQLDGALEKLGNLRSRLRAFPLPPGVDIKYRMQWIKKCTDLFGISHCHALEVDKLVQLFAEMSQQSPPSLQFPSTADMLGDYTV